MNKIVKERTLFNLVANEIALHPLYLGTGALLHNERSSQVQDLLFLVITPLSMGLEMAVAFGAAVYAAIHEVSHDSLFTALVLSASKPWLVEPVREAGCTFDIP